MAQRGEAGARLLAVLARVQRARRHLAGQARLPRTRPALHRGRGGLGRVLGELGLGGRGGQQGHAHSAHAGAPRRGGDFPATSRQLYFAAIIQLRLLNKILQIVPQPLPIFLWRVGERG